MRASQRSLVKDAVSGGGLDEAGGFGDTLTSDHRPGARFLGIERLLVASCPFGRVRPDRSPGVGVFLGIPDWLSAVRHGVDGAVGVPRGDGVDDLSVGEHVTVPMEVRLKIAGRFGHPRADDEPQPGLIERGQVRC